ncbi:MAG: type V CRISPR-associated protein Cas12a/Cpf1 [Treponema sp.]|nr:type V CRISPR-associated protein Cas12a/Cpf1 [Treponema sp.]
MKMSEQFCGQGNSVSESLKELTGLYGLSKTLRFELKPEPDTKQIFEKWIEELQNVSDVNEAIKNGNLFAKDKVIYKAYLVLKPILDSIHEQFITLALQSEKAKDIDFSNYFEKYRNKEKLDDEEKKLRIKIGELYSVPAKEFAVSKKGKTNLKESKPYEVLTDKLIFSLIEKNISSYTQTVSEEELKKYLEVFKGFFTYFSGYNINRENYYETKEEKSTAVASRIVHENLPVFCNNIIRYETNKEIYNNIYNELKKNGRETKLKTETGEKEAAPITEQFFNIDYFSKCLSQNQIDSYNDVIGNNNLLINLYNQLHSKDSGFKRIQLFETLYKQIGCGKRKSLFLQLLKDTETELTDEQKNSGEILSLEKLLSVIAERIKQVFNKSEKDVGISTIPDLLEYLENCKDWKGIYWNKASVTSISNKFFMNWHDIADKLSKNSACATFNKNREEQIKLNDAVELDGLFSVLDENKVETILKKSVLDEYNNVINPNDSASKNLMKILCSNTRKSLDYVLLNTEKVLAAKRMQKESDSEEDIFVSTIKNWLDSIIDVFHFVKNFEVRESKVKGNILNSEIKEAINLFLHSDDATWFKWYDIVRNYLTKKPQDDVKNSMLKLNFGSSSLLGGWSDGQEKVKIATLLKYDGSLFLCILKDKNIFDTSQENNSIYKKDGKGSRLILRNLGFKTLAGKGFLSEFGISYGDMGKENPEKAIKSLQEIIKTKYIKKYPALKTIANGDYSDKKKFDADISEVLKDCYICSFENIDWDLVQKKEKNGDLFLLKIWCKDFAEKSNGHKNLQTLYWENVLSENSKHQLCAGAEIFMRKPIDNKKPYVHEANSIIICKKGVPDFIYEKVKLIIQQNKSATEMELREIIKKNSKEILSTMNTDFDLSLLKFSKKEHEIIKDKRFYGENKYFFYCPIKLNYSSKIYKSPIFGYSEINTKVNEVIQKSDDITYLGIDRGEKHLIYTCVINKEGKIIDCRSQNKIEETDYNQKLSEVAESRQKARKNWQTIGNISNLKEGYISNVVHNVVSQAISKPTYIVLEDLNTEMKRGRQKIEKQVYQKFEVALAKKLNFVVEKTAKENELASVGKALQLTPPIANYQDIENKKQFGIMLYTRANYTSVTDPLTGWRKTVYLKKGSEEFVRKQILESFTDIGFDGKDYYFEYVEKHAGKTWRMYSGENGKSLPRFQNNKKLENDKAIWEPETVDLVSILDELFADFSKEKSLLEQLSNNEHQLHKVASRKETAWDSLRYVIDTIQHIRNTGKTEADSNFLYSPVRDENGIHFDSRNYHNNDLPADADANGAFNIARKGLIMDSHIKQWIKDGKKDKDLDLFVSDEEWDLWLLDKEKWHEKLSIFASRSAKEKQERKRSK